MTEIFIQKNNEEERKIALVENGILLEYYEEEDMLSDQFSTPVVYAD